MKKRRAMKFTDDGIYIRARESAQESPGKQPEAQTGDETEKVVVFGMETSLHLRIPERVKTTTQHLPYVRDGLGHSLQDQRDEVVPEESTKLTTDQLERLRLSTDIHQLYKYKDHRRRQ
ncbi:hypothetical protein THAOC_12901 [Thalassiosira oceanica]|uniref:Uncharacterized protein n=1 Tax=Thalassiosira oceanica TaxID=159749 RepID=K0SLN2_THAOC|nr:hypothetical protein THAOC_12901 [Thalassiosira oceanica]|eukprot:EJK66195.1 hypothetical protein THAOC_12901 [Thalassiosira oceanica]